MTIKTKPPSKEYDAGWDRIFGKETKSLQPMEFNVDKDGNIDEPGRPVHGLLAPQPTRKELGHDE